MQLVLFDDPEFDNLYPFTFTRPVADIRIGILTIREKWERRLNAASSTLTRNYLSAKYPLNGKGPYLFVNGSLLPDEALVETARALKTGETLMHEGVVLMCAADSPDNFSIKEGGSGNKLQASEADRIVYPWDIFTHNANELAKDFKLITNGRKSAKADPSSRVSGMENVFIEEGAVVSASIINANTGPVYIGRNAEVMEGCMIRGPFSLGGKAVLKMGSKVYGATTVGPGSKAAGELSNAVIFGNSNKAHDGFLGNSVIGEWCNLGADTNNSNLKNNYGEVTVWNYRKNDYIKTGLQFCGMFMGDHSKCAINTMFNTGTLIGVSANIFGAGFPDKHIPSFHWGGPQGREVFIIDKALELASRVYARRDLVFGETDRDILSHLYLMQLKPPPDEE